MKARASFRSQLLIGSVLWTLGLLLVVTVLAVAFLAHNPRPHMMILGWFISAPPVLVFVFGLASMTAGALRIRRSLRAVDQLRINLAVVHAGDDRRVAGTYPAEVQPLVDSLNALLAEREQQVQRALAKAGDLAHGLKTPLAVLSRDADRAAATGDADLAESLGAQVERMRRQIEYHLAHARAAAGGPRPGVKSLVALSVDGLFRTLDRIHAERSLTLQTSVPATLAVKCQREDLDEMLGNLLDNACKWSCSRVRVHGAATGAVVTLEVDDDGPGLDATIAADVMRRGVRADERVPGSGLGLAIVRDLADIYGGSIELVRSPLGGVRARLQLPAADGH